MSSTIQAIESATPLDQYKFNYSTVCIVLNFVFIKGEGQLCLFSPLPEPNSKSVLYNSEEGKSENGR